MKQIEEMAKIIINTRYKNDYISPLRGAEALYNAGYRKVNDNEVVISNEEYEKLKFSETLCEAIRADKKLEVETAKKKQQ